MSLRVWNRAVIISWSVVIAACAARAPLRPVGAAVSDPTAIDAFTQATKPCTGLKTLTAEIRLSGRAGSEKIRGTLHAGFTAPAALRFEAVAPFGPPVFILAGRDNRATLLLPRDNRVLPDADVAQLLERLTGLALAADDVRLILSGCLTEGGTPVDGRSWPNGWRAVTVGAGITAYLGEAGNGTVVVAADHGAWRVDYSNHLNGFARTVRIRSTSAAGGNAASMVDISAVLDQLEINTGIDEKAFVIDVPAGAIPMTLDDLRAVAPLRGSN